MQAVSCILMCVAYWNVHGKAFFSKKITKAYHVALLYTLMYHWVRLSPLVCAELIDEWDFWKMVLYKRLAAFWGKSREPDF